MSIKIKLFRNNIKRSSSYGKYFAKSVSRGETTLKDLAIEASKNSTLRESDVIAVITEVEEMLRYRLAEGQTVVLDGIGRFSLRVESEGVDNPGDFNIRKHIRRVICRFLPSGHRNSDGTINYHFSNDVKVEWAKDGRIV